VTTVSLTPKVPAIASTYKLLMRSYPRRQQEHQK
jgi:hypothetical protein